jgi:HK97 family phage major capsid protein
MWKFNEERALFRAAAEHYMDREVKFRFKRFIQYGTRFGSDKDEEFRDLLSTGTGGSFIPQEFYPVLTEAQKSWGGLINAVNSFMTKTGASIKVALQDDTAQELVDLAEGAAPVETDPSLSDELAPTDIYSTGIIKLTLAQLQDQYFNVDNWLKNTFAKRYFRGLSNRISAGSTSGNVQSILTGATAGPTTASATAIAYADILALYESLDEAYRENGVFSMNDNTRIALLSLVDTTGRPLLQPDPSTGELTMLLGKPVVLNPWAPDIGAGAVGVIQFGDFEQGYLLRVASPGVGIARLVERFANTLEVGFIGYVRASGKVTDAGTHPIMNLVMHA